MIPRLFYSDFLFNYVLQSRFISMFAVFGSRLYYEPHGDVKQLKMLFIKGASVSYAASSIYCNLFQFNDNN